MTASPMFLLYENRTSLRTMMVEAASWSIFIRDEGEIESDLAGNAEETSDFVRAFRCRFEQRSVWLNRLRSKYPAAGIIVLADKEMFSAERLSLLFWGADYCVDGSGLPMELVASLQALWRRGGACARGHQGKNGVEFSHRVIVSESATKQWELKEDCWLLVTPQGREVLLTQRERHVLHLLMTNCPNVVGRRELAMKPQAGELGRGVDVHVHRLKQKLASMGEMLPIRSIRGHGYMFVGTCA